MTHRRGDGPLDDGADRRLQQPSPLVCATAVFVLAFACVAYVATSRGIWLDEFWSQRLGDPGYPLGKLIDERWLSDTHPPLANLLYLLTETLGARSIVAQRLVLNLLALAAFFAASVLFARTASSRFPYVLFVLVMAFPGTVETFADFRSYGWQIAAAGTLVLYASHLLRPGLRSMGQHRAIDFVGLVALFLAIALHYVTGIIVSIFVVALAFALHRRGDRRHALRILGVAGLGWAAMLASGLILIGRLRHDVDFGWIQTSTPTALGLYTFLFVTTLLANVVVSYLALRSLAVRDLDPAFRTFTALLVATVIGSIVALIAVNMVTPIIIQRYLIAWQILLAALIAALALPALSRGRTPLILASAVTTLMLGVATVQAARFGGWWTNRDRIAQIVAACPTTKVYAMSQWRLSIARASNAAHRETLVIDDAYRSLAADGGFAVEVVDLDRPARLRVGPTCPTILWVEHLDPANVPDVGYVMRAGNIALDGRATLELRPSGAGFLVVATPLPARDQNLRATPK